MTTSPIRIQPFDHANATREAYRALNTFNNRIQVEILPDDPPMPLEEAIQRWQNIPPFIALWRWNVWEVERGEIIASSTLDLERGETNQHLAEMHLAVLPHWRQQGVARRLLPLLITQAQAEKRRLLLAETVDRVPAGAAFMARLGARRGIEAHTNQLVLAELDFNLLHQWQTEATAHIDTFTLGLWIGAYPEEYLAAITQLHEVMNSEPRDQLEMEDDHMTPTELRQLERSMIARGTERWTFYLLEQATGQFAGFTEVFWNANRPALLNQGATGVFPAYRNRGLGRWLKAAMLEKVLRERPQVRFIRTGNADSNAPMLKLNHALGFKPFIAETVWQVETDAVAAYLAGKEAIDKR
jgi:mycothiol synthase